MEITLTPATNLLERAQSVFNTLDISDSTREDYKKSVKGFIGFIGDNPLTHNSFLNFKQYLKARTDIGVSSKNKYLVSGRVLLKEMNRTGLIHTDITQNIKGFKQGKKHKKDGISDKEMDDICRHIKTLPDNSDTLRFKTIVTILSLQGLREKELTGLKISHINLANLTASIIGKGHDDYEIIPLHPQTVRALTQYVSALNLSSGYLFFDNNPSSPLSTRSIRRIITTKLKLIGIHKSTHGFRHYFVTKLIKEFKGDLFRVIELSRHKSLDMLQVYNDARLSSESLPTYYNAFRNINL